MQPMSRQWREFDLSPSGSAGPAADPAARPRPALNPEHLLNEMRALLDIAHPASDAEALSALRRAFPATSLAARVAAIQQRLSE